MFKMKKILVISGHPHIESDSLANKTIVGELRNNLPNATIHNLGELYPDYQFDIPKEQSLLMAHDVIVLQFPMFWYSVPSLLQKWLEDVFVFGFSHGIGGDKLKGKKLVISVTTGAPKEAYSSQGIMGHTVEEFLYPIEGIATLTQMQLIPPVYLNGVSYSARTDEETTRQMTEKIKTYTQDLVKLINSQ